MIIVSIDRCKGIIKGYSVSGHARYKPTGEDIVCAGVSMLAQTTILGLEQFTDGEIAYSVNDAGILKCSLPDNLSGMEMIRSQAILETMVLGMKNLQKNYAKHIRVFRRRWTSC